MPVIYSNKLNTMPNFTEEINAPEIIIEMTYRWRKNFALKHTRKFHSIAIGINETVYSTGFACVVLTACTNSW